MECVHCHNKCDATSIGLCYICYQKANIRKYYRLKAAKERKRLETGCVVEESEVTKQDLSFRRQLALEEEGKQVKGKPVWQAGQPFYRCFYCDQYRCDQPLKLCPVCQRKLDRQLKTLRDIPEYSEEYDRITGTKRGKGDDTTTADQSGSQG